MAGRKTLILLRHGKAEPAKGEQEDHERPLADRGFRDSERMGEWLAAQGIRPDKILCSTSQRTRQTFDKFQEGYGKRLPVAYESALYLATDSQLLKIIAAQPDSLNSLMLIGHNPGMHELALKLATEGDEKHIRQLAMKFPTGALAWFALNGHWEIAVKAGGTLQEFVSPKTL